MYRHLTFFQDVASTAEVELRSHEEVSFDTTEEIPAAADQSMDVDGEAGQQAAAADTVTIDSKKKKKKRRGLEGCSDDNMEDEEQDEGDGEVMCEEKRKGVQEEVESSTKHLSFLFEALEEPALIDVLGRTPALAQAVSRLLPFLTYGRTAAARLLADKFTRVSWLVGWLVWGYLGVFVLRTFIPAST